MKERWKGLWKESEKIWNRWEGSGKTDVRLERIWDNLSEIFTKRWTISSLTCQKRCKPERAWQAWGTTVILSKWFLLSRLETRTKESIPYASVRVQNPYAKWKWKVLRATRSIDRPSKKGLSKSILDRTRKMVNYAWVGWSLGKPRWRLVAVLTCKLLVKLGYRGERLIEPSSSWFPPKFPSG